MHDMERGGIEIVNIISDSRARPEDDIIELAERRRREPAPGVMAAAEPGGAPPTAKAARRNKPGK
jgi:hypothetical protein